MLRPGERYWKYQGDLWIYRTKSRSLAYIARQGEAKYVAVRYTAGAHMGHRATLDDARRMVERDPVLLNIPTGNEIGVIDDRQGI